VQDVWGTPPVARNLAGEVIQGKTILVYTLCTSIGNGDYNGLSRTGELKVVKRSKEIRDKVNEFIEIGIPNHQIFLMGHSAGAWASLLVLRSNPDHVNSVIAFAPAFAGKYKNRNSGWEWIYNQQKEALSSTQKLPALVYAFEKDPYNRIDDLVFLDAIPGVVFKPYKTPRYPGNACNNLMFSGHRTDFGICFAESQKDVIKDYLESRLTSD
jgi:pimeloyl-ACP methyl ester carboxylesterase